MNSIRLRTAGLVAVGIKALLVVAGVALMFVIRSALTAQFDESLVARAEALRSLTRFDGTKVEMDFAGEAMPRFARSAMQGRDAGNAEYFVAWVRDAGQHGGGDGAWRVLERSESLGGHEWPGAGPDEERPGTRDVTLPGGGAGRAVVIEFTPSAEHDEGDEGGAGVGRASGHDVPRSSAAPAPPARVLVAMSRAALDRTLAAVGWSIFAVGVVLALANLLVVRWAVGRGLAPVDDLSKRVQALGPDSLNARFESAGLPVELRPIAEQLSALLARLEEAFERERRFSAAASHELRTPIAELRMLLEVARTRTRTSEEWHDASGRALGVLDRAQALCEMLLRLARADASVGQPSPNARADVGTLIAEHVARAVVLHGGDARLVRVECEPGLTARIEPAAFGVILANVLDNALRHGAATADDPVTIHARRDGRMIRIDVSNPAPALAEGDLARLFEPFWRKDDSRADQRGFGLGLAVARSLARAARGDISVRREDGRTLTLCVSVASAN